ncbi:winged helix-turn-helix domain-containing protein [Empedobacter brevis]|uniref:winged helix-turn-helix domain-containing protein n=1 Tax=Empedobacter brevis TaxID=247 RepID=UPI00123D0CD1|nr:crosslink repair DNA glycosylase YcaQ family protein [Empedobacter brevis]QES93601.1 winged helix-turn-helix domain-containing protein [Empedobacter brevis]
MTKQLTLEQLQQLTLQSQGLAQTAPFGTGKEAVLRALEHLGYVQIDTLAVVERAHHHTLWSRIPDYNAGFLDELVAERAIFEYWFHAASYLPMKAFRYVLPQMLEIKQTDSRYYNADPRVMQYIMDTIRAEGPKKARDFESKKKSPGSWWNWKPAKLALERLFMQGDLMISGRNGMQKTYDITERVLPEYTDTTIPTPVEFAEYLVNTYLRAYGFTTVKQVTHLKKGTALKKLVQDILEKKLQDGTVQKIHVEGMPAVFVQQELMDKPFGQNNSDIRLLSPFDNSVIHRDRVQQLFGFEYRLECYTPKEKRQYGYFCLPVLFGGTFIGRIDCKAHRKEKRFEIIHLHIENETTAPEIWIPPFAAAIKRFAVFNGCETVTVSQVSPSKLKSLVKQVLR